MSSQPPPSDQPDPQSGSGESGSGYAGGGYGSPTPPSYGSSNPPSYGSSSPSYGSQTPPSYGSSPSYGQPTQPTPQGQQPGQQPGQPAWGQQTSWGQQGGQGTQGAQAPYGAGSYGASATPKGPNFLNRLFDLSFSTFITPSIVKLVYIIVMVFIVIGWLSYSVLAFTQSAAAGLFVLIIVGPIVGLVYLILARIGLEFYLAVIRLAEDVRELKDAKTKE